MRKNIERAADLNNLEHGYGSKVNNYGASIPGKDSCVNGDVYYENQYRYKENADNYCKKFVSHLYKIVQHNPGDIEPKTMFNVEDQDAYWCAKQAVLQGINYMQTNKIVEFDADINALNGYYIFGKLFSKLVENNRFDSISGFAIKELLAHADNQINGHLYPQFGIGDSHNHEMGLVGKDCTYDASSDV